MDCAFTHNNDCGPPVLSGKELSWKVKLSINKFIYLPTFTYDDEVWLMIQRTAQIQVAESASGQCKPWRLGEELLSLGGMWHKAAAPLHRKISVETFWTDVSRVPLSGCLSGTSNWRKTTGQNQNWLESLTFLSGLGTLSDPPGAAECVNGERDVCLFLLDVSLKPEVDRCMDDM